MVNRRSREFHAFQQLGVEGEADLVHLAALLVAQQFAGTADYQIMGGQGETGAEDFEGFHRLLYALRFLFATRPAVMGRVLGIVYRTLPGSRGFRDRDAGLTGGSRVDSREIRGLCFYTP